LSDLSADSPWKSCYVCYIWLMAVSVTTMTTRRYDMAKKSTKATKVETVEAITQQPAPTETPAVEAQIGPPQSPTDAATGTEAVQASPRPAGVRVGKTVSWMCGHVLKKHGIDKGI